MNSRLGKTFNENLGLIIALIAAVFAGWSAWEAEKTREDAHADAMYSLKVTQRSYVRAEDPSAFRTSKLIIARTPFFASFNLKAYGNSPAFNIQLFAHCKIGMRWPFAINNMIAPWPKSHLEMMTQVPSIAPGSQATQQISCDLPDGGDFEAGVVEYGEVDYEDVFGDRHYTHFCYFSQALIGEIAGQDKKAQENKKLNLASCRIYNDAN